MKNVLLATTAIALTAGYAAADVSYGASAKLVYGNFGTGTVAAPAALCVFIRSEFDFTITGSGEAAGVAYSAGMTLMKVGRRSAAFSMSSNGFTYAYDANDFGGLVTAGADGEDDKLATGCCHMLQTVSLSHTRWIQIHLSAAVAA